MLIRNAQNFDLENILLVEKEAFIPNIQESKETFEKRLFCFPKGFFVLQEDTVLGYYCSELWDFIPRERNHFLLNHSPLQTHKANGNVLYISSVALKNECRGKNLGSKLFAYCTQKILLQNDFIQDIVLLVNENWKTAYHIYKKNSFKQYAVLNNFFSTEQNNYSSGILMKTKRQDFLNAQEALCD